MFGVNTAEYDMTATEKQDSFLDVTSETNVMYTLDSGTGNLKLLCTFTDGSLTILHVLEKEGSPSMTKSTDNLDTTKNLLVAYQQYSGDTLYGKLSSMLDDITPRENSTLISDTIKLEATNSESRETFTWSYTVNGVDAAMKCVSISFEDGFLKHFIDTWNLHKIGNTNIGISEDQAIQIALESAKTYSWDVKIENETFNINNFKLNGTAFTKLVFCDSLNADNPRDTDVLTIFPMWRIGISLDKVYPGNVYGISVDVWADNKQVRDVQEVFTSLDSEFLLSSAQNVKIATIEESSIEKTTMTTNEAMISYSFPAIPVLLLIASFSTIAILTSLKAKGYNCFPRKHSFKVIALLICFLIVFIPVVSSISTADARGASTIWGSLATPKTQGELDKQDDICEYIDIEFGGNGWISDDFQGSYSTGSNLLSNIESVEANYPRVATVWFDHGIGENLDLGQGHQNEFHFMLCDSNNDHVFDYQIYDKTDLGRTKFAFINTCLSSRLNLISPIDDQPFGNGAYGYNDGIPIGMPYAWTHGAYLDSTGYASPDTSSSYCYIGYPWGSASLDQPLDSSYGSIKHYDWVHAFFDYALNYDMTVKQALDHASYECFPPQYFDDTNLYNDFTAEWDPLPEFEDCTMTVYGNANIKLYQQPYTITTLDAGDEGYLPTYNQYYPKYDGDQFQLTAQPNQYHVFSYWQCTSGSIGISNIYSNPATFTVQGDATVRAVFEDKTQVYVNCIEQDAQANISPGSGWYASGTQRTFNYYADQGYEITHVEVDDQPVSITGSYTFSAGSMWTNHKIEVWTQPMATVSFYSTHLYYGGEINMWVYIDGDGGHQMPYTCDLQNSGTHDFEYSEAYGYVWVDHVRHYHDGTYDTYYSSYLNDIDVDDNDYLTAYYDTWGAFMMTMGDLGYDEEYIESLVFDEGISPQVLNSYAQAGLNLNAVGILLDAGFQAESFQPIVLTQSTTWSR